MAIDERARHELRARLEEILGTDEATTLMYYLPPMDWSDVATKRDLDQLADRFRAELHREIGAQTRNLFFGVIASNATLVGLVFAAVKLA